MIVTLVDVNCADNVCEMMMRVEMTSLCTQLPLRDEIADIGNDDDSSTGTYPHHFVCIVQLTEVVNAQNALVPTGTQAYYSDTTNAEPFCSKPSWTTLETLEKTHSQSVR